MNWINMRTVTKEDTVYGVYFEDKIVEGIYHSFDKEEFYTQSQANNHLKELEEASPEWAGRLSIFKIAVEKIS